MGNLLHALIAACLAMFATSTLLILLVATPFQGGGHASHQADLQKTAQVDGLIFAQVHSLGDRLRDSASLLPQ